MKTKQILIKYRDIDSLELATFVNFKAQLGFVFGSTAFFENEGFLRKFQEQTGVQWVGCSTAGEISAKGVTDDTVVITAIHFENPKARFKVATTRVIGDAESEDAGKQLGISLAAPDLTNILLFSPGLNVNGSHLIKGVVGAVGKETVVTGGLAGDGSRFQKTYTLSSLGACGDVAIGVAIYGDAVQLRHGCMGGWDPFGKIRQVTKAKSNIVYELDGKPALDVYKEYLGEYTKDLPGSGLMFPFAILNDQQDEIGLIRTILSVDEAAGSLIFAGDIEQAAFVRLMHANTNGLVEGAIGAAKSAILDVPPSDALALIVSCVGRKLVMGPNVDEEVEAVSKILGENCAVTGFYSYGEVSPFLKEVGCQLHNQTLTLSYIFET